MGIIKVDTRGHYDFVNITEQVTKQIEQASINSGAVLVFVAGTTAALTMIEYENGVIEDIKNVLENMAPEQADYKHHKKWGDANGAAHIKAALIGPDLLVPIKDGKMMLGTWQQIVLIDFDEKPRSRQVIIENLSQ
ncbi:YjbQ family protein [Candidatus Parcubacteria bacterium]|jgi:secondary thiamine-phosphate synthase enzyme|nr:YjbQ family protein [Candidatus Parcubacteria bacterium]